MKKTCIKLVASALMGAAFMGGCVATGILIPRPGPSDDYKFVQAQIAEMQATLESFTVYDQIAANPIDEFAGLE